MSKTTKTDLRTWLAAARQVLAEVADQPSLEAQAILGEVLGQPRAWIFAHSETDLSTEQVERLNHCLQRRRNGEPLPYVLGHWEFYGLNFFVSPAVLIPRPETELLVDQARVWANSHPAARFAVDVGTGSGCIAAALASWCPQLVITAIDRSAHALALAGQNLQRLGQSQRVSLLQSDLISCVRGPIDLICANLPYIPTETLGDLPVARHEPVLALDGGPDGLRLIERLCAQAVSRVAPVSRILLEIEFSQGGSAPALVRRYFPTAKIQTLQDLSGLPRLVIVDIQK